MLERIILKDFSFHAFRIVPWGKMSTLNEVVKTEKRRIFLHCSLKICMIRRRSSAEEIIN